jgi:hypothetical protein
MIRNFDPDEEQVNAQFLHQPAIFEEGGGGDHSRYLVFDRHSNSVTN